MLHLGVEAQTLTVWRQADRYAIPRIIYANKMDRSDASLPLCIKLLKSKFNIVPLQLQIPIRGQININLEFFYLLSKNHKIVKL